MIYGLSKVIEDYAYPLHYEKVCCFPVRIKPEVSFVGRFGLIMKGKNPADLVRYSGEIKVDEVSHAFISQLFQNAGMGFKDDDDLPKVQIYLICYLLLWLDSDYYKEIGSMTQSTFRGVEQGTETDITKILHSMTRKMSKFSLRDVLNGGAHLNIINAKVNSPQCPKIHYALDGIDFNNTINKVKHVSNGYVTDITNSELRFLYRHRSNLSNRIIFYRGKREVEAPWVTSAADWAAYQPKTL